MFAAMKVMSAGSKLITVENYAQGDTGGTGTLALTINKPSGVAVGDVLAAFLCGSDPRTWTMPSGWTEVKDQGAFPEIGVAYLVAGASEPSSYVFTPSSATTTAGIIVNLRNAAFDVVGAVSTSSTISAPSITLSKGGSAVFAFYAGATDADTWTTPTGMTPLASHNAVKPSYALFYQLLVPAGSTGNKDSTGSGVTSPGSVLVGFKPA